MWPLVQLSKSCTRGHMLQGGSSGSSSGNGFRYAGHTSDLISQWETHYINKINYLRSSKIARIFIVMFLTRSRWSSMVSSSFKPKCRFPKISSKSVHGKTKEQKVRKKIALDKYRWLWNVGVFIFLKMSILEDYHVHIKVGTVQLPSNSPIHSFLIWRTFYTSSCHVLMVILSH